MSREIVLTAAPSVVLVLVSGAGFAWAFSADRPGRPTDANGLAPKSAWVAGLSRLDAGPGDGRVPVPEVLVAARPDGPAGRESARADEVTTRVAAMPPDAVPSG